MIFGVRSFFTKFFVACAMTTAIFVPLIPVQAAGLIPSPTGKCPTDYQKQQAANLAEPCPNGEERDYSLDDIKSLLAIIGNLMLSVSGAIVLFCFVLGGFFWVASAGNQKMVDRGKTLISSAVIGLIIMFTAYTLVIFAVRTLTGTTDYNPKATGGGGSASKSKAKPQKSSTGGTMLGQNPSIIKAAVNESKLPAMIDMKAFCSKIGGDCQKQNTCGTEFAITNACGESAVAGYSGATLECCMSVAQPAQTTACGKMGGTCQDSTKAVCNGAYVSGFCSGGGNEECCFKLF